MINQFTGTRGCPQCHSQMVIEVGKFLGSEPGDEYRTYQFYQMLWWCGCGYREECGRTDIVDDRDVLVKWLRANVSALAFMMQEFRENHAE
jgi:ssDNA-binding Zn-finger/Zn-ribbon topoisomerase 1